MNIWQAIVNALKAEGISHIFGLPGGDLFYDALYEYPEINPVLVREESSGAFMAMAYARMTGKPGVCYAASGPGMANLVPGIMEAESACVPIIAICGASNVSNAGMGAFQEVDQMGIVKPITKWAHSITSPERTPWVMGRAFSIAANGKPGPVYIEVPKDTGTVDGEVSEYTRAIYPLKTAGDPEMIKKASQLLLKAQRPLIVAGGGSVYSQSFKEVAQLAEHLDIPIMTTPCGRSIVSEDHPLAFGLVGLYFNPLGEKLYSEADLIMTIGSRNEDFQSGRQQFFPEGAKYIQIDIDPFEIGRNWIPDVPIVGDAGMVLRDLLENVKDVTDKRQNSWTRGLVEEKRSYLLEVEKECCTNSRPIKTKRVVRELNQVFGKNTILVNENGSQDLWSYHFPYYKVLDINSCIAPGEQTCMGFGITGAIGAKLAQPSKKVVCVTGDGAFQMFMKELPTAVQHNAPVTYIVLNNFGLGWIKFGQKGRGGKFISTDFHVQPDFVMVAEANQCYGERVEEAENIRPAIENALKANEEGKTAVIEFIVDGWDFAPGFESYYDRLR